MIRANEIEKMLGTLNVIPNARVPREYADGDVFADTYEMASFLEGKRDEQRDEIALVWNVEDVLGLEGNEDMTVEEAREVLALVERRHDATFGVSRDTLESASWEIKARRTT